MKKAGEYSGEPILTSPGEASDPPSGQTSDTPRTDAKEFTGQYEWAEDNTPLLDCVESSFARALERELAAANSRIKELEERNDWLEGQREIAIQERDNAHKESRELLKSPLPQETPEANSQMAAEFVGMKNLRNKLKEYEDTLAEIDEVLYGELRPLSYIPDRALSIRTIIDLSRQQRLPISDAPISEP